MPSKFEEIRSVHGASNYEVKENLGGTLFVSFVKTNDTNNVLFISFVEQTIQIILICIVCLNKRYK